LLKNACRCFQLSAEHCFIPKAWGNFAEPEREYWIAGTSLGPTGAKLGRILQQQAERGWGFFQKF